MQEAPATTAIASAATSRHDWPERRVARQHRVARLALGLLAALAIAGCEPGGVAIEVPWIALDPPQLDLVDVAPDEHTLVSFGVHNTGTGLATVHIDAEDPLVAVSSELYVEPDQRVAATLRFEPDGFEPTSAVVLVSAGDQVLELPVSITVDDDLDDDGHPSVAAGGDDCDDRDADVHPEHPELCDDLDNDCNDLVDDVLEPPLWYPDADEDGYGDELAEPFGSCDRPALGWVSNGTDCDDTRDDVHPGATEIWYDGLDQDCDGGSDYDRDGDGWDNEGHGGEDCADSDPDVNPDAEEVVDGVDNDCDGVAL